MQIEWEEWGNPQNTEFYDYMKSYSPVRSVLTTEARVRQGGPLKLR